MKKLLAVFLIAVVFDVSHAQISIPKVDTKSVTSSVMKDFIKPPAIGDIGATTSSIVNMLTSKLSLTDALKPKLTDAIGAFLKDKKLITGLADTNPADYLAKFGPLQKGLFTKMKGIIGADAFTKMMGLKPSGSSIAGNPLSNLFF